MQRQPSPYREAIQRQPRNNSVLLQSHYRDYIRSFYRSNCFCRNAETTQSLHRSNTDQIQSFYGGSAEAVQSFYNEKQFSPSAGTIKSSFYTVAIQ